MNSLKKNNSGVFIKYYLTLKNMAVMLGMIISLNCWSYDLDRAFNYIRNDDYTNAYNDIYSGAKNGNAWAQYSLGWMYYEGKGVIQNDKQAVIWYRKAAQQGLYQAQYYLGWMYQEGRGVDRNKTVAMIWYRKAVEQGKGWSHGNLGEMYLYRIGSKINERDIPNKELEVAKESFNTIQGLKKIAKDGDLNAQVSLASIYIKGNVVTKSCKKALVLYEKAAEQGSAYAEYSLGKLYEHGECSKQNKKKALSFYLKSAKQGNKKAQFNLSALYYELSGIKDLQRSYQWGVIAQKNGFDAKKAIKVIKSEMSNADVSKANKHIKKCLASHYRDCL